MKCHDAIKYTITLSTQKVSTSRQTLALSSLGKKYCHITDFQAAALGTRVYTYKHMLVNVCTIIALNEENNNQTKQGQNKHTS